MNDQPGYVVVDVWRSKPGKQAQLEQVLRAAAKRFREADGVISVDYARLDTNADMYLVIFRYRDRQARDAFVEGDDCRGTMAELRQLWDLESPIYRGETTGF